MYKIALIQNQSEMSHYGYADARLSINYDIELFTANNIEDLSIKMQKNIFDAIIIGTNALNDKTIRETFSSKKFKKELINFLDKGKGLFVSMQLRMAQNNYKLDFLPKKLNNILPMSREKDEKSIHGRLRFTANALDHITTLYPNSLSVENIEKRAKEYNNLPGIYWHYLKNIDFEFWDILIEDETYETERALLIALKGSYSYRIMISALPIDWQKQNDIFENILLYIVEGQHNTATLSQKANTDISFNYLLNVLKSKKFPLKEYFFNKKDIRNLKKNLKNGVHLNLLVSKEIDENLLYKNFIDDDLKKMILDGKLVLSKISVNEQGLGQFSISGNEDMTSILLQNTELQIHKELLTGYIDGSFLSTVESLEILESLETEVDYCKLISKVIQLANEHDRNGAYDEVFGASCAFLWLRATYLGRNSEKTLKTLEWIRTNLEGRDNREKILAYTILIDSGLAIDADYINLKKILYGLDILTCSEIDLIIYLKVLGLTKSYDIIEPFLYNLKEKQINGYWIDLATTADAVIVLADILNDIKDKEDLKIEIRNMIYGAIIYIQKELYLSINRKHEVTYYWDNKASTTIKCIAALVKFNTLITIPVNEIVEFLSNKHNVHNNFMVGKTALSILENQKNKVTNLEALLNEKNNELEDEKKLSSRSILYLMISIVTVYILTSLGYGMFQEKIDIINLFKNTFMENWVFHFTFIAVIFTGLQVPWKTIFKRKSD